MDANEFLFNGMDGLAVYVDCRGISTRPPMMLEKGCSNLECKGDTIFALVNATIHIIRYYITHFKLTTILMV